jgi:hypothetical protein
MRGRTAAALVTALVVAALFAGTPASAAPLDKGHIHDVYTDYFDCDSVSPSIPTRVDGDVRVNFTFNLRGGKNVFPYYRESVHGTNVFTNLATGGTFTEVFDSNSRDHKIVNNGDGTITIYEQGSGGDRYYDTNGRLVLKEPGNLRWAFDIDYNGTPGDPDDDIEVPDSFRIIREPTGRNDTAGRDFARTCGSSPPEVTS